MRKATAIALTALAVLLPLLASSVAVAQPATPTPAPTEIIPADGSVLSEPPQVVRMCFSEPALHDETDDFDFNMLTPDGRRLGLRIVFQPLTTCVDVHIGLQALGDTPPFGEWTFEWEIVGEESGEPASGALLYQVSEEGGSPVPPSSPVVPFTPQPNGATPTPEADGTDRDDDDGLGAVWIAVIAVGASVGVLSVAGGAVLLLRRRGGPEQGPPPA